MSERAELERSLSADDAEERRRAAAELRALEGPVPVELLVRALGDIDWRVRKEAVTTAIALAPSAEVLGGLVGLLAPGDNVGARNSAVDALAGYGLHSIAALARALPGLDADGRKLVVDVLAKSARPESLPLLRSLLRDADVNVRGAAVEAVAAIGEACAEEAIALLDVSLDSPERFERLAALEGLNRLFAVLPWERLEPLAKDPILLPAVLKAAGRSGADAALPLVFSWLAGASGKAFADALACLVELDRASAGARDALRQGVEQAPREVAEKLLALAADEDAEVELRRYALAAAVLVESDASARVAVSALADDALAEQARSTLSQLGSIAIPALIHGAGGALPEQRAACISLLGPMVALDPDANAATKRALSDPAHEVVAAALDALAEALDRSALEEAEKLLAAGPVVRRAAQRALAVLARRYPRDALDLGRVANPSAPEAEAVAIAVESLAPHPDIGSEHVAFLEALLRGPVPAVRCAALSALAALGGEERLEPLTFALGDEEPVVRLAAVRALGRLADANGKPLGLEQLEELATHSSDLALVAQAARALGGVGEERSLSALGVLVDREPLVAVAAIEALAALEGPSRDAHLARALSHTDSEVVKSALRAFASKRDPSLPSHLGAALDHRDWDVRRLAAELLGLSGGDRVLSLLRGRVSLEPHELVREELMRAIADVEAQSGLRRTAPPPSLRGVRRE